MLTMAVNGCLEEHHAIWQLYGKI